MQKPFYRLFLVLFLLLASCQAPPQPSAAEPPWRATDLRALKAPGDQAPSQTLAALYVRETGAEVQVRLDLLDFDLSPDIDLYLALDTRPGGARRLPVAAQPGFDWDALITLTAAGQVTAVDPGGAEIPGLRLRLVEDAFQDSVIISLDRAALGISRAGFRLQAFITVSESSIVSDSLGPVNSDQRLGPAPSPSPAQVLLSFWDTFPAASPAEALRAWNGAHTGPSGGRHGLVNLLNAAQANKVPLTLLDLKTPASLSALDTIEGSHKLLRTLIDENLLSLADVLPVAGGFLGGGLRLPDWALQRLAAEARSSAQVFQFPAEPYLYSPLRPAELTAQALSPYRLLFSPSGGGGLPAGTPLFCRRYQSWVILPLPMAAEGGTRSPTELAGGQQAVANGLSLDTRRALLELAAQESARGADRSNPCSGKILLLGGDLARSTWGDPASAQAALSYLAGHPWIQALRPEDLLGARPVGPLGEQAQISQPENTDQAGLVDPQSIPSGPDGKPIASGMNLGEFWKNIFDELKAAPPGPLSEAAWQMVTSLLRIEFPVSQAIYPLRAGYLGQAGIWLAASKWAMDSRSNCQQSINPVCAYAQDLDWDGQPEYILASPQFFAVFNPHGGFLVAAFMMDENGPHQIIGPSWQLLVGLSDPSTWAPDLGIAGDPRELRGAFSEIPAGYAASSWELYFVQTGDGELRFTSPDGRLKKTFRLTEDAFVAAYDSQDQVKVQVPLVIDPWSRFIPGWTSRYASSGGDQNSNLTNWTWGLQGGPRVKISATPGSLNAQPFSITENIMSSAENPDYQYPPGHYLPYPIALVEVEGQGSFSLQIMLK